MTRDRAREEQRRRDERAAQGVCYDCSKPAKEGRARCPRHLWLRSLKLELTNAYNVELGSRTIEQYDRLERRRGRP